MTVLSNDGRMFDAQLAMESLEVRKLLDLQLVTSILITILTCFDAFHIE